MVMNSITILICTHNRAELLVRTLEHLNEARRPSGWSIEVQVVANACTDNTLERLDQFRKEASDGLPLNWIDEPTPRSQTP